MDSLGYIKVILNIWYWILMKRKNWDPLIYMVKLMSK